MHRTSPLLRLSDSDFEWSLSSFRAQCGRVTMLINNAGILPARPFLEFSDGETLRKIFEVNTYSQVSPKDSIIVFIRVSHLQSTFRCARG